MSHSKSNCLLIDRRISSSPNMMRSFLVFFSFFLFSAPSRLLFLHFVRGCCMFNRKQTMENRIFKPKKIGKQTKGQVKVFLSSGKDLYYQYLFYQEVLCPLAGCIYNTCSAVAQRCCVFPT